MSEDKTNENTEAVVETEELTVDENEFFGTPEDTDDSTSDETPEETEAEETTTEDDTPQGSEEEDEAESETAVEDDKGEDEDSPKSDENKPKPKNRFQERIDDLTAKFREEERKRLELEQKLAEVENKTNKEPKNEPETPAPKPELNVGDAPSPDAKTEDGEDKYPLGEFDPNYIKDLVKYNLDVEQAQREAEEQKTAAERKREEMRNELTQNWQEKVASAAERYPDFNEKGQQLVSAFENIDGEYGDYLTSVLMGMDHGPDVLYYLAENPDVAQTIVNSGATNATLALGRIEARFESEAEANQQKAPVKRTTNAPPPAPQNKGSNAAQVAVAPDTDNLAAFEKLYFKKSG